MSGGEGIIGYNCCMWCILHPSEWGKNAENKDVVPEQVKLLEGHGFRLHSIFGAY
jgi:hypothetical protein